MKACVINSPGKLQKDVRLELGRGIGGSCSSGGWSLMRKGVWKGPNGWEQLVILARWHGVLGEENAEEAEKDCWGLAAKASSALAATISPF